MMSLKRKIASILVVLVLFYIALDFGIQYALVYRKFVSLEESEAKKDLGRCIDAIKREIYHLNAFTADWAFWDDSYDFMKTRDPGFIKTNLTDSTFKDSRLNMVYFCQPGGKIAWGRICDQSQQDMRIEEFKQDKLAQSNLLIGSDQVDPDKSTKSGILLTSHGPMIISARPILPSSKKGCPGGTLIMGKFLDTATVSVLVAQTQVPFNLESLSTVKGQALAAAEYIKAKTETCIQPADNDTLWVYRIINDLENKPALLIRADVERHITCDGKAAIYYASASVFVAALLVLVAMLVLLTRTVLGPIHRLSRHMNKVGKSDDLTMRIDMDRSDEIGHLADKFNHMCQQLAQARSKLVEQSYNSGKSEIVSGIMHNLRNALTPVVVRINSMREEAGQVPFENIEKAKQQLQDPQVEIERKEQLAKYFELACTSLAGMAKDMKQQLDNVAQQVAEVELMLREPERSDSDKPFEKILLKDIIKDSLKMLSPDIACEVTNRLDQAVLEQTIETERLLLLQVLDNIYINAAESIASACVKGEIVISGGFESQGASQVLHLIFSDNGAGVAPENLDKIFKRGFSTKQKSVACGIGMHWCANTVSAMGGRIWIESQGPGKGADLHLVLGKKAEYK